MNTTKSTYTCADLGVCQSRSPRCADCLCAAPAASPQPTKLPLWAQRLLVAAALGIACFALGYVQNTDAQWREIDLAAAQAKGYHKGYNQGSSAGLLAAHRACEQAVATPRTCDAVLVKAVVAYADEVQ